MAIASHNLQPKFKINGKSSYDVVNIKHCIDFDLIVLHISQLLDNGLAPVEITKLEVGRSLKYCLAEKGNQYINYLKFNNFNENVLNKGRELAMQLYSNFLNKAKNG